MFYRMVMDVLGQNYNGSLEGKTKMPKLSYVGRFIALLGLFYYRAFITQRVFGIMGATYSKKAGLGFAI